jgi:hypothetical protein
MSLTAERIDEILTNFVLENDAELAQASQDNREAYEVVMGALTALSNQFGSGKSAPPTVVAAPVVDDVPEPIITPVDEEEAEQEVVEELTMDELKEAIKSLKPLADFDDDIKAEINSLKSRLNALKKKKS